MMSNKPPAPSVGGVEVEIVAAGGAQRRVRLLGPVITIGRGRGASLLLKHDDVSRRHADVEIVGDGMTLRDASTNGTWVLGQRVQGRMALAYGDPVSMGPFTLRFYPLPPEAFCKDVSVDEWAREQTSDDPTR